MDKPVKPNITIPAQFAANGTKTDFDDNKIQNGFDRLQPDVLAGDNLNKLIDDTYKGLNYAMAGTDAVNLIKEGEVLTVKDGKLVSGSSGAGLPVGSIFPHTASASFVPENSLPCDGMEYAKDQFGALYNDFLVGKRLETCTYEEYQQDILLNGACAKFGVDTVKGTFKVPTIPDGYYVKAGQGTANKAGLPNITGEFSSGSYDLHPTGAFKVKDTSTNSSPNAGGDTYELEFKASYSNSIYGKTTDTVETNAVAYRYFVVVATGSIKQSEMDWSAWASSLANKANTDLANVDVNIDFVVEHKINPDGSWFKRYKSGWLEQGGRVDSSSDPHLINFLKPFNTEEYSCFGGLNYAGLSSYIQMSFYNLTPTSVEIRNNTGRWWMCVGQGA